MHGFSSPRQGPRGSRGFGMCIRGTGSTLSVLLSWRTHTTPFPLLLRLLPAKYHAWKFRNISSLKRRDFAKVVRTDKINNFERYCTGCGEKQASILSRRKNK